ncbi:hypothetical protein DFJ77DRAFT_515373 [Powellomyces hirtus]|nr:hypothetical protein DFJ77DRAFT_515373 [Powellomyces hirtus]
MAHFKIAFLALAAGFVAGAQAVAVNPCSSCPDLDARLPPSQSPGPSLPRITLLSPSFPMEPLPVLALTPWGALLSLWLPAFRLLIMGEFFNKPGKVSRPQTVDIYGDAWDVYTQRIVGDEGTQAADGWQDGPVVKLELWAGDCALYGIRQTTTTGPFTKRERIQPPFSLWGNGVGTRTGAMTFTTNTGGTFESQMRPINSLQVIFVNTINKAILHDAAWAEADGNGGLTTAPVSAEARSHPIDNLASGQPSGPDSSLSYTFEGGTPLIGEASVATDWKINVETQSLTTSVSVTTTQCGVAILLCTLENSALPQRTASLHATSCPYSHDFSDTGLAQLQINNGAFYEYSVVGKYTFAGEQSTMVVAISPTHA